MKNYFILKMMQKYKVDYRHINKKIIINGPIKVKKFVELKDYILINGIEVKEIIIK